MHREPQSIKLMMKVENLITTSNFFEQTQNSHYKLNWYGFKKLDRLNSLKLENDTTGKFNSTTMIKWFNYIN